MPCSKTNIPDIKPFVFGETERYIRCSLCLLIVPDLIVSRDNMHLPPRAYDQIRGSNLC